MVPTIKTPGVYIQEANAFPNSVVPVATAVPAFIGYTPKAEYEGKSYYNKPVKITSFADFQTFFMLEDSALPTEPTKQYHPQYYLIEQETKPNAGDYMIIAGKYYSLLPDPATIYYFYNSVRLFYQNGGADAYIVAVGSYGNASDTALKTPGEQIVNPNIKLSDLTQGLALLKKEQEPTMYICPEATLLSESDNATLMQTMLRQAKEMQTAICILDIIGGDDPDPVLYTQDIERFRKNTGTEGLKYGASYYPFIGTNVIQSSEIDFTNLFGGDVTKLAPLINSPSEPNESAEKILQLITSPPSKPLTNNQLQNALVTASTTYSQIMKHVLARANVLPACGAMAGIYTANDNNRGVWHAPANTGIASATHLPIRLSDSQQADLNVDAVSGKSINAIRFFSGKGILVWGARTLDGNSQDWRYIPVRRTITFLAQSIKLAVRAYVFEPNNATTWGAIKSMISNFLTSIWQQGGLQGTNPDDAFQVGIGLGSTMTANDLANDELRVEVSVAITRPAEFIVITFTQKQAGSA